MNAAFPANTVQQPYRSRVNRGFLQTLEELTKVGSEAFGAVPGGDASQ